jgi:TRAP-type C4-dicarboxylate transport system substrate-binding protein
MRLRKLALVALLASLLLQAWSAGAQEVVTLKLATLAPSGSAWHDLLKELGQEWERLSGGQVKVKVYAGGAQGSEGEMIRKLNIGQLQAAALSNVGLHDVVTEPQALSVPLLFRDEGELACAFERIKPALELAFERKGLVVVSWSRIGAATFFCNVPVHTPAELGRLKLFAWEGDPGTVEAWRRAGFQPVVLSSIDLVPALQTGMIDCVGNVPLYALTARLFDRARYQVDLPWSYVTGATVVRRDAWEKVPAGLRPPMLEAARRLGARVDGEVKRLNADAVEAMKRQGLQVVPVDAATWRPALERSWAALRGPVIPAAFFDEVVAARDACRAGRITAAR